MFSRRTNCSVCANDKKQSISQQEEEQTNKQERQANPRKTKVSKALASVESFSPHVGSLSQEYSIKTEETFYPRDQNTPWDRERANYY